MYNRASIIRRLSSSSGKNQIRRNVSTSLLSRRSTSMIELSAGVSSNEPKKSVRSSVTLSRNRSSISWVETSTELSSKTIRTKEIRANAGNQAAAITNKGKKTLSTTANLSSTASNEDALTVDDVGEKVTVCFDVSLGKIKTSSFDDNLRGKLPNPFVSDPSFGINDSENDVTPLSSILDNSEPDTKKTLTSNNKVSHDHGEKEVNDLTETSISEFISTALQNGQWGLAYKSYTTAKKKHLRLDIKTLESIILNAERKDLKRIYQVFKTYKLALRQSKYREKMNRDVLNYVIHSLSLPRASKDIINPDLLEIINNIQSTIKSLDEDPYQHDSLPKFIHAILSQKRNPQLTGKIALYNLKHMVWNNFPVDVVTYEKILSLSTYRKQIDFPFHKVLAALVNQGTFPSPLLVTKILHNQYPFTDVHHTKSILNSILRLQKESIAKENGLDYRVDFGTLEYVTYAAAKRKSTDLILLVWDIVEMLEYTPSESMYENTIQSFVMSKRQDHKAFAVLADMEQKGFVPSRALLSTMNRSIRVTERRVDNAMRILKDETPGTKISVNSLNCILSAYASNGLVDKAFETYDNFTDYEIIPNSDTFAYLMESLSVDANTLIPLNINDIMGKWEKEMDTIKDVQKDNDYIEWKSSRLMAADVILLTIEDKKIVKNEHIIHEYIRLLCAFKETEKAKDFITGILNSQEVGLGEDQMISLETFVILSSSCALNGQMESALEVVELSRRFGYCNGLPEYAMCRLNQLKTEAE